MSVQITTPADLSLNDSAMEEFSRSVLTGTLRAVVMVKTANSVYTVVVHGADSFGNQSATVMCPEHKITGASMAVLHAVSCHVVGDTFYVRDGDTTLLRSSSIVTTHVVDAG